MPDETPKSSILYEEDSQYMVRLTGFEGPLELLLHLIRKHKYDIYDIPIASILKEYLEVLEAMQELNLDLAGEFLVMASTLAQIKSRMLLPRHTEGEEGAEEGQDPRLELVKRLLDYERFREAAGSLEERPLLGRDVFSREHPPGPPEGMEAPEAPIEASLIHLIMAFKAVLKEASEEFVHEVERRRMTTPEAMEEILDRFRDAPGDSLSFRDLFPEKPTREKVIALFMGLLELVRIRAIRVAQSVAFGEIRLFATPAEDG